MDAETLRARLRKFIEQRGLKIADWCRRAGIDASSLYSFVRSRTHDLGATRLLALAAAEGVSVDEMLGISSGERSSILERVAPIVEAYGSDVTLADVAREIGMTAAALQVEWPHIDDLIIDTYIHIMGPSAASCFAAATAPRFMDRLRQVETAAVAWSLPRLRFLVAFQVAILRASPPRRAAHRRLKSEAAQAFWTAVMAPARDIKPMEKSMQIDVALSLIEASIDAVRSNFDQPDNILDAFMARATAIMAGKIVL